MKRILDACCGSRMCWFDRDNPDAVFMDTLLSKELQAYSALKHHCMEDGRSAWRVIGNIHDNPELIE